MEIMLQFWQLVVVLQHHRKYMGFGEEQTKVYLMLNYVSMYVVSDLMLLLY